ncbi:hypothetical protein FGO68_gene1188 [Halteria grandinella]|uniref:RRM domain-containing protein n=1 Tax=Halteria grandinella TaxID=5974 RepID=A0A8J8P6S8_HALGN|nr:hypothetical protein FGO68_gene1188 [Halteria grandinella]
MMLSSEGGGSSSSSQQHNQQAMTAAATTDQANTSSGKVTPPPTTNSEGAILNYDERQGGNNSSEKRRDDNGGQQRRFRMYIRDLPCDTSENFIRNEIEEQYSGGKIQEVTFRQRKESGTQGDDGGAQVVKLIYTIVIDGGLREGDRLRDKLIQKHRNWDIQVSEVSSASSGSSGGSVRDNRGGAPRNDKDREREREREKERERERDRHNRRDERKRSRSRSKSKKDSGTRSSNKGGNHLRQSTSSSNERHRKNRRNNDQSYNSSNDKNAFGRTSSNGGGAGINKSDSRDDIVVIQNPSQAQQKQAGGGRSERVRELWVGNLPEHITEKKLYSHFFVYGEIEKIEIVSSNKSSQQTYAFVRFKLISCTSRAYDQTQQNQLEIDGYKLKVQFSDFNKRPEIVGDVPGYDCTYLTCTALFVAFSVNSQLPPQEKVEEVFSRYGKIRAIYMKQTTPNTQWRPHVFVDYYTHEEAKRARDDLYYNDQFGQKRLELGDKSCEVLLAIKKRCKDFQNPVIGPNSGNGQNNAQNSMMQQPHIQIPHIQFGAPNQQQINPLIAMQQQQQQMMNQQAAAGIHGPHPGNMGMNPFMQQMMQQAHQQNPLMAQMMMQAHAASQAQAQAAAAQAQAAQAQQQQQLPSGGGQENEIIKMLLDTPDFKLIAENQPQVAKDLVARIQSDPNNARQIIEHFITELSQGRIPQQQQQSIPPQQQTIFRPSMPPAQTPQQISQPQMQTGQQNFLPNQQVAPQLRPQIIQTPQGPMIVMPGQQPRLIPPQMIPAFMQNPQGMLAALAAQAAQQQQVNPAFRPIVPIPSPMMPSPQVQEHSSITRPDSTPPQLPSAPASAPNAPPASDINDILAMITKNREKSLQEQQTIKRQQSALEESNSQNDRGVIPQKPSKRSVFEEDVIWSGFFTRNKEKRTGSDAYKVSGEHLEQYLPQDLYNLNVSHRTNYEDLDKYPIQGVVVFVSENDTQQRNFNDYIQYFLEKERMGMVYLKNGLMFLVPPCPASLKYFNEDQGSREHANYMVGVFIDQQSAQQQAAKFSMGGGNLR